MEKRSKQWNKKHSIVAGIIILAACALSLGAGRYHVSPEEILNALKELITGKQIVQPAVFRVICSIRLPRILGALLCGAGLAVSGAAFQAVFSNPLASADTIGVGNAASFGAVLAILLGADRLGIQISALMCGILAVLMVYIFSAGRDKKILKLVLCGMIVSTFFSSMVSFVKYAADPQDELPSITYWLLGSLKNMSWDMLFLGAVWIIPGLALLYALRWKLDVLMLSEDEAKTLGVSVFFIRMAAIVSASAITSAVVSMCGQIGWIGLLIPHLCRIIYKGSNRNVIPSSIVYGGIFLLFTDTIARSISASEIPAAILTSMIGAPLFLILLLRTGGIDE